ncbi:MAG: hypothetical protein MJK12_11700 [Colwellia sp.]|nr:hypothetical protein [Colwellia sp.]
MNTSIHKLALFSISVALVSCSSTTPPVATLPDINIASVPGFEGKSFNISNSKILVAPGIKYGINSAEQEQFSLVIRDIVVSSGSEVIDRNQAARFAQEIQLSENLSESYQSYQGPVEAKFAIIPTVTYSAWESEYERSSSRKNKKGETIRYPAQCKYQASAKGNIQIRELPSMRQIMSINVVGTSTDNHESPRYSSCRDKNRVKGIINKAISDLIEKGENNYITLSKYVGSQGIITGAKSQQGKIYFETNLGRFHGAREDASVTIYQEIDGELVEITDGEMMDAKNVLRKKSYITVDSSVEKLLKRGMVVMLSGKCSGLMCDIKTGLDNSLKSFSN